MSTIKKVPASPEGADDIQKKELPASPDVEVHNVQNVPTEAVSLSPLNESDITTMTDDELTLELERRNTIKEKAIAEDLKNYESAGAKVYTGKKLETQKLVPVMIPYDGNERPMRDKNGVMRYPVETVGINGQSYEIRKGVQQWVPQDIADRIESSQNTLQETADDYDLLKNPQRDIRQIGSIG